MVEGEVLSLVDLQEARYYQDPDRAQPAGCIARARPAYNLCISICEAPFVQYLM